MDEYHLSATLRKLRLGKGLSLSQLALKANTSVSALSRYENGWGRFEIATLNKICTAMGCEVVIQLKALSTSLSVVGATRVINQIKYLFWDQKINKHHLMKNPIWIVERVIEFGTLMDVWTLIHFYGRQVFLNHVSLCRFQSIKTKQFWLNILEREGVPCMKRSFQRGVRFY